jgi:hypothetical protein
MTIRSSSRLGWLSSLAATFTFAVIAANPAMALPVTFAQYGQANGSQQWTLYYNGVYSTIGATGPVFLTFLVPGTPFSAPEAATFSLTGESSQPGSCGTCGPGDNYTEAGYNGSFSFLDNSGNPLYQGHNLLTGTFTYVYSDPTSTGATIGSTIGGGAASFRAATNATNLLQMVFTSDYMTFPNQIAEAASFSLSSLIPNFGIGTVTGSATDGQAFPDGSRYTAAGTGTFSSNPGPVTTPEPASLGLMIGGGLCAVAFGLRKRGSRVPPTTL